MDNQYDKEIEKDLWQLAEIGFEAAQMWPPFYLQSIFGPAYTWVYPRRKYSEFNIINPWKPLRTLTYLRDVTVPSLPKEPKPLARTLLPPLVQDTFWRATGYFQQPDPYDSVTSFPKERWFYINGIATNQDVARMNSAYLAQLFHRPITVVQNSTNSIGIDLLSCVLGKGIKKNPNLEQKKSMTEPSIKAAVAILDALNADEIEKVVVIAHSEGTIIISNVLMALRKAFSEGRSSTADGELRSEPPRSAHSLVEELFPERDSDTLLALKQMLEHAIDNFCRAEQADNRLAKLEIYPFANCANRMNYVYQDQQTQLPYIENFANERDLVARLGVLSPENHDGGLVSIDGPVYENTRVWSESHSAWGHLLNQHHLFAIDDYLSALHDPDIKDKPANPYPAKYGCDYPETPRLYGYFHGEQPDAIARAKPQLQVVTEAKTEGEVEGKQQPA